MIDDLRERHARPGTRRAGTALTALALFVLGACSADEEPIGLTGEQLFKQPFAGTNGRSCATCHVPEDDFTLKPAHVARLLEQSPDDPLFNAIDADDPTAETLTFEHLKKGLVRVWLPLPTNMDLVDDNGNIVTPDDRKLFVWRGVPSIANTATSAPFQLDGRIATLEEQAQEAVVGHSQGHEVSGPELERIAAFARSVYSSDRARFVADQLAKGVAASELPDVEDMLELSATEERGRDVYQAICAACHGGANAGTIVNREIQALAFPKIKPNGTVLYTVPATEPPTLDLVAQPENEFLNIGSAYETFLGQLDPDSHVYTKDLSFPQYRYRFYTDDSRQEIAADLPPIPPPFEAGFANALDGDGNPITGPNFGPQLFSADPGRALISGSALDFEAFDVPTLRGIGSTAPYFHNNAADTLDVVVDLYSDHILSRFPSLTLPGEKEDDDDGDFGPPEALTPEQKRDLIAFLKVL